MGIRYREMDCNGRPIDGKPLSRGDTFLTASGNETNAIPSYKSIKKFNGWLIENAIKEAKLRKDGFNLLWLEKVSPNNFPPDSKTSTVEYLFDKELYNTLMRR